MFKIFNFSPSQFLGTTFRHTEFVLLLAGQHTQGKYIGITPWKNQDLSFQAPGPKTVNIF